MLPYTNSVSWRATYRPFGPHDTGLGQYVLCARGRDHRPYEHRVRMPILMPKDSKTRFKEQIMTESTEKQTVVERASGLSDQMLESVDAGRQAVIEAVRKFVSSLEEATPALADESRRNTVIDAALNLTDELSKALIELVRSVMAGASEALTPGRHTKE